ncbi:hypothetical protein L0Y49_00530, partial [bacterium]|nr:hypothetical protein [bacterium]
MAKGRKYIDAAGGISPELVRKMFAEMAGPLAPDPRELARERHQLAVAGNRSIIATNSTPEDVADGRGGEEKKEKENLSRLFAEKMLQDAIDQRCRDLDRLAGEYGQLAAWHRQQAEDQRRIMELAAEEMRAAEELREEIAAILGDAGLRGGKIDRDRARRALEKAGINVPDDASDEEIRKLLEQADRAALDKKADAVQKHNDAEHKAEDHDSEAEELEKKAREILKERDRIMKEGKDKQELKEALDNLYEENQKVFEQKEKIKDEGT